MSRYRIDYSALGYFHVRKALGPWPLSNWSWSPVYTTTSELDAERWIREAKFSESKEGRRISREKEIAQAIKRQKFLDAAEKLKKNGWYEDNCRAGFVNIETGEFLTNESVV